jgi:hypothetical protein
MPQKLIRNGGFLRISGTLSKLHKIIVITDWLSGAWHGALSQRNAGHYGNNEPRFIIVTTRAIWHTPYMSYQVVDSCRRPVSPVVFTPMRAKFYLAAFRQLWPTRVYEIATVSK